MQARVRLTTFLSLIFLLCLNTMPGLDLNEPINWDEIGEFEGEVHELNYDYVWDDGNEGNHRDFSLFFLYSFIVRAVYLLAMIQLTAKKKTTKMKMAKVKVTATQLKQKQSMANLKQSMANLKQAAVQAAVQQVQGAASVQQVEEAGYVPQADAGDEADVVAFDSGTPLHALIILFLFLCMQS